MPHARLCVHLDRRLRDACPDGQRPARLPVSPRAQDRRPWAVPDRSRCQAAVGVGWPPAVTAAPRSARCLRDRRPRLLRREHVRRRPDGLGPTRQEHERPDVRDLREHAVVASLDGIGEVEARSEFVHWVVKPSVGDRLVPTRELREAPYIVMLCHDGDDATTDALLADVRRTILWNTSRGSTARAQAIAGPLVRRARRKLRWLAASRFGGRSTTASRWA